MQVYKDYINGELVRFVEQDGKIYVDSDDLLLLFKVPTVN